MGSTNLNIASWLSNCELDAMVENEQFAHEMQEMYLQDLKNATEIVLDMKHRVIAPGEPRHSSPVFTSGGGSTGRAAAGAIRIGNAIGAAFTDRRVMEPVEARILITGGFTLAALAILFAFFPRLLAYPLAVRVFVDRLGATLPRIQTASSGKAKTKASMMKCDTRWRTYTLSVGDVGRWLRLGNGSSVRPPSTD